MPKPAVLGTRIRQMANAKLANSTETLNFRTLK